MLNLAEHENLVSSIADKEGRTGETIDTFGELIRQSYDSIEAYLYKLPAIYRHLVQLYYLNGLTQDKIAKHLDISQAAVSTRLATLKQRLRFVLQMPSQEPMQVKRDLHSVLAPEVAEFAICFYWEVLQNRVRSLIETSTSGASNKLRAIIREIELVQSKLDFDKVEDQEKLILTEAYLDYFRTIQISGDRHKFAYRKNDESRRGAHIECQESANELFSSAPTLFNVPDEEETPQRQTAPQVRRAPPEKLPVYLKITLTSAPIRIGDVWQSPTAQALAQETDAERAMPIIVLSKPKPQEPVPSPVYLKLFVGRPPIMCDHTNTLEAA